MLDANDITESLSPAIRRMLLDLFMVVADAYDGAEPLSPAVKRTYERHWKKQEVKDFYGRLVDLNSGGLT